MQLRHTLALALCAGLSCAQLAHAQATLKEDGKWRYAIGAGASFASGNSDSTTLNLNADGVRATANDKLSFNARLLYGKNDDVTTSDQLGLGVRYDRDIDRRWFGFGTGDYLRDRPANLSRRLSVGGGVGYHVIRTEPTTWDVFGGIGYTHDAYRSARLVAGETRDTYGRVELLLGEESTHALSDTTSFKQRFVIYPNLSDSGEFRASFDAGLSVAMNRTLSLTVTLGHRYNSDPGSGLKKGDTILVTGVSARF